MMTQTTTPDDHDTLFNAIGDANEIWAVVGMGGIAFRFGPFKKEECGSLMSEAIRRGVGMTFIIQSGRDVPWELMREISPANYDGQEEASPKGDSVRPQS